MNALDILADRLETPTKVKTKEYKIAAISSNRQSFGHNGHIMVARDGQAIEGMRINGRWQTPEAFKRGDIITFEVDDRGMPNGGMQHGFELFNPFKDGTAPDAIVQEVWAPSFGK